jgi:hypothetical protein
LDAYPYLLLNTLTKKNQLYLIISMNCQIKVALIIIWVNESSIIVEVMETVLLQLINLASNRKGSVGWDGEGGWGG